MRVSARTRKKKWIIHPGDSGKAELARSLKISPLIAQLLINRGIGEVGQANGFLRPKLTELIKPEKMPGINGAVERIGRAVSGKEKITVYGDYDVDGITGVSVLWQILKLLGAEVDYYIPHRVDEGYGLNEYAVRSLVKGGTKVLVTVDCGIGAVKTAEVLKELGVDLIITDHHQRGAELPDAVAIVHPCLDDDYGNQDSSGVMVAFKLAWAIANSFSRGQKLGPELREFMLNATSLTAMGTVADVMDLRGENRILISYGLKSMPDCKLCGVQALIESAGLGGKGIDTMSIGFRLAPLLNAAGRMGHARLAVELLTSDSLMKSMQIAEYLKQQNSARQRCEKKITKRACEMVVERGLNIPDSKSIVLSDDNWHTGVIGIVASRIVDKFYRPTIMINVSDGIGQGSGRSIEGFNILGAIEACSDYLSSYGGHKMAAGITIDLEKIEDFTAAFEQYVGDNMGEVESEAVLKIDAEVALGEFSREFVEQMSLLEPFGQGNPRPMFVTKGARLIAPPRRVGSKGDHLQIAITDRQASLRCIGFGMGKYEKKLVESDCFNVAYFPQINHYNGNSTVQLVLADISFDDEVF